MKFRRWEIALVIGLAVALSTGYAAEAAGEQLSSKLVRLHVVADGDSAEQQAVKLKVRDAVLHTVTPALEGLTQRVEAENALRGMLPEIEQAARECLNAEGAEELTVGVTLENEAFPTREYDTFALPAGEYLSLRVTLGSGEGRNWWCVVFPPLCASASMESLDDTTAALLDESDRRLITRDGQTYVLKFKLLELLEKLRGE